MEVLLHHYTFGKPRFQVKEASPPPLAPSEAMRRWVRSLTKEERMTLFELSRKAITVQAAVADADEG